MFAAENGLRGDPRLKAISDAISVVPNFPKPGIMFQDITTLVSDHKVYKHTVDIFVERYRDMGISVVAGVEARGFIFAPPIALAIGAKFIPLRKPGKLPGEVISEAYELEYGSDCLEMRVGAVKHGERALVVDDLVATGGTLSAAIRLLGENVSALRLSSVHVLLACRRLRDGDYWMENHYMSWWNLVNRTSTSGISDALVLNLTSRRGLETSTLCEADADSYTSLWGEFCRILPALHKVWLCNEFCRYLHPTSHPSVAFDQLRENSLTKIVFSRPFAFSFLRGLVPPLIGGGGVADVCIAAGLQKVPVLFLHFPGPVCLLPPVQASPVDRLKVLFPDMEIQLLEKALEESGNDLDLAIKSLHELCLRYSEGNSDSTPEENEIMGRGEMPTGGDTVPLQEPQVQNNLPLDGAEWVDLLVKEMMNATSIDDARGRAAGVLESLEKSISSQASVEAAQNFHKENLMLKEQIETLLRDNIILKRAVAIQHERQKENDERTQEVQQLKQLVVQYQEQLRTLEVNNYALTLHLHQAQQSNSIPGRFHPDVF
ncbi:UNVERIFIED_CONTAM: Adenine phosphoribosyltransferase 5 [Sesamum radiatum]|uniref:adenine phosphoribosyltransferase n=1 Tax=Sesamum radiatum TaxID=300843 RepID=A0AAW2WN07_SESRA